MKKHIIIWTILILIIIILIFHSCATVPIVRVRRPWKRSLSLNDDIKISRNISSIVYGKTNPLLGNDNLLENEIKLTLDHLLKRKGYLINSNKYDYRLILTYETKREDSFSPSSLAHSYNNNYFSFTTASGSGSSYSLGVSIAGTIGNIFFNSFKQTTKDIGTYNHCISMEIFDVDEKLLWKGESTWDTPNIDILLEIIPAIQILISDLPSYLSSLPKVKEVKEEHAINYYMLYCWNRWFACPALPFRIYFGALHSKINVSVPEAVKDVRALDAYVDLIQTAEFALPVGIKEIDNPLKILLWKKVMLGSQYYIGSDNKPLDILIKLTGEKNGYRIEKCWVATDKEYEEFQSKMSDWKKILLDYYDVYK